jgi:hypothetical protein
VNINKNPFVLNEECSPQDEEVLSSDENLSEH